jgi:hypothetical protein
MARSNPRARVLGSSAVLVIAAAAVAVTAANVLSRNPSPVSPGSSPSPSAGPILTPGPTSAPSPTPPGEHPPIAGDIVIKLSNATGHAVTASVRDTSGRLAAATSGMPGGGMSVRWGEIVVRNVDARTLSVTWVGLPTDDEKVHVAVSREGARYVVDIVQKGPPQNSDAVGYDRVLLLTFDQPVSAADVIGGVSARSAD